MSWKTVVKTIEASIIVMTPNFYEEEYLICHIIKYQLLFQDLFFVLNSYMNIVYHINNIKIIKRSWSIV